MSKSDIWMPLYVGDYLADTMSLTTLEHGAYLLLLMEYWKSGPLPNDDKSLRASARITAPAWLKIRTRVRAFFYVGEDGLLHQKRADAERAKTKDISEKRRDAALSRRRRKSGNGGSGPEQLHSKSSAIGDTRAHVHNHNHSSEEARASSEPTDAGSVPAGARDVLWQHGVPILALLTGKSPDACRRMLGKLLREVHDDCPRLMHVLQQAREARPVDPLAWITSAVRPPPNGPPPNGRRAARNGAIELMIQARERSGMLITDTLPDD